MSEQVNTVDVAGKYKRARTLEKTLADLNMKIDDIDGIDDSYVILKQGTEHSFPLTDNLCAAWFDYVDSGCVPLNTLVRGIVEHAKGTKILGKLVAVNDRAKALAEAVRAAGLTVSTVDGSLAVSDGKITAKFADNWKDVWPSFLDGSPHYCISSIVETLRMHIESAHKWQKLLVKTDEVQK